MKRIFVALLLCALTGAEASSLLGSVEAVGAHTVSYHSPDNGFNNYNFGAYVRTSTGVTAGGYRNSFNRPTYYVGWTTPEWHRLSLTAGVGTGYRVDEVPHVTDALSVMLAPTVRLFTAGKFSVKMVWIPRVDKQQTEVFHWVIERRFE